MRQPVEPIQSPPPVPKIQPTRQAVSPVDTPEDPNRVEISELGKALKAISGAVTDLRNDEQRRLAQDAMGELQKASGNSPSVRIDIKALAQTIGRDKEEGLRQLIRLGERLKRDPSNVRQHIEKVKREGQRDLVREFQNMPEKTKKIGDVPVGEKTRMEKILESQSGSMMPKGVEAQVAKMKEVLQRLQAK